MKDQGRSTRKRTGGRLKHFNKKKRHQLGREPAETTVGETRLQYIDSRGNRRNSARSRRTSPSSRRAARRLRSRSKTSSRTPRTSTTSAETSSRKVRSSRPRKEKPAWPPGQASPARSTPSPSS